MDKRSDIPLRILLVASDSARRAYLAEMVVRVLNGRAQIAADSRISLERFVASKSGLLLADLDNPAEAAALVRFLENAPAGTGSIALADEPDPGWVRSALRASLNAIIARDAAHEDIHLALQAAEAGLVLLHPTSASSLIQHSSLRDSRDNATEELTEELTVRESEVLRLVSMGLGNKEVAGRLAISEHTVKFHISSILGKLHAGSRTEAVSLGIRRGLIPI
ncbi:MAG TPA: response regulator transcription factor [Candidatus Angelobacter sp.]|jgi:DNA-binding NarL/FixJ family response regulator|nr:response regulator transcription factor [Candidatus Angelobacter sp.]